MAYRKIAAVVPCAELEGVEHRLRQAGLPGVTIAYIPGDDADVDSRVDDWTTKHAVIEIFAKEGDVDLVVNILRLWSSADTMALAAIDEIHDAQPLDRVAI